MKIGSREVNAPAYPTYDELPVRKGLPGGCSWGVFPNDVGTLNFVADSNVRDAAQSVRRGTSFSLNWSLTLPDPPILGRGRLVHHRLRFPHGGYDDYYDGFYPQASSQWDTLAHVRHPDHGYYNGRSEEEVASLDEPALGIDLWPTIAGRFVLIDLARHFAGTPESIDPSQERGFTVDDLEAALASQDTRMQDGDILLLRFGWIQWYESLSESERRALASVEYFPAPGLDPGEDVARWLWDRRVAAVAADVPALESMPLDTSSTERWLHARLIPLLGYAVGEMFALDALAADCEVDSRYSGLFVSAPLNMRGGAGSPANAVAMK